MNPASSILVWRDSVCAGDDGDAPHELSLAVAAGTTVGETVQLLLGRRYLASIQGGRATWVLEGRVPLAVIAQQWAAPGFLVQPGELIQSLLQPEGQPHLQLRYLLQEDPEVVFNRYQSKPSSVVPSR